MSPILTDVRLFLGGVRSAVLLAGDPLYLLVPCFHRGVPDLMASIRFLLTMVETALQRSFFNCPFGWLTLLLEPLLAVIPRMTGGDIPRGILLGLSFKFVAMDP